MNENLTLLQIFFYLLYILLIDMEIQLFPEMKKKICCKCKYYICVIVKCNEFLFLLQNLPIGNYNVY